MKSKALTIALIVLVVISLLSIIGLVLKLQLTNNNGSNEPKEPTIDEIVEASVDVPEITTNLSGKQYIKISLKIQTNSKKAAEELRKRDFQINNIVIQELSEMTSEDFDGKSGKRSFEDAIKGQLNPLMQQGEIEKVYIVSYIIN